MNRFTRSAPLLAVGLLFAVPASAQDELTEQLPRTRVTVPVVAFANGGVATVVYTNFPGAPSNEVPGLPGVAFDPGTTSTLDFDRVYGSGNGNWILTAAADLATSEDEVLIVNGMLAQQEGQPGPWTGGTENCGTIDTRVSVNASGDFVFATNTDGAGNDDYIVTNVGGVWGFAAREGDAIVGLPGNTYDDIIDSPLITDTGLVGFAADGVDGTVTTTEDDLLILGDVVLLQEGVSSPTGQSGAEFIENFDFSDFFASADGSSWAVQGDLTGSTSDDDVVIVDGAVVLQENVIIPGSGFANPVDGGGILGIFMDAGGNWFARGNNDTSEIDWVVRNGDVIAKVGDPIVAGGTELWSDAEFSACFFLHVGNANGDYVIGGVSDGPSESNGVLVLNGTEVICREGDPVDIDGNGMFDDDVFINTFGNDDAHLTDDGTFYMVVTIKDGMDNGVGQAFISIDLDTSLGTNYCTAIANSTGGTASITATGSNVAADNDLTLTATGMPAQQFGIFVTSQTQGATLIASGNLCVAGNIVRFQEPGQVLQSDMDGAFSLQIDTTSLPAGVPTPIMAGETWNFTAWYRDTGMMGPTANFTDGVEITFE